MGYVGEIALDAVTLPETLRDAGYETIMVGKWHNTPVGDTLPGGPKYNWPAQRGFDTLYGFMGGETHHCYPSRLMLNNVVLPLDKHPRDYYSGDDWMDQGVRSIHALRESRPDKPFFLYVANNAMHSPLQAKDCDMAKYRGRYAGGWSAARAARHRRQIDMGLIPPQTRLPPSAPNAPHWDRTDPRNRELYARHMEAYAGMLDNADQNVGKLVRFLGWLGELDNTLILFSSDNGGTDAGGEHGASNLNRLYAGLPARPPADERKTASRIGGPRSAALYPAAWGELSNTPFPSFKTYTGAGGRRVTMIVSWPDRLPGGGAIRRQFMHVTDVMPTVLALAGVSRVAQRNGGPSRTLDGMNCASMLTDDAPSPRREQYYECWSNRAFFRYGWLVRSLQVRGQPVDLQNWTLHDLDQDFPESTDLAARAPEKLAELVDAFDRAAWANDVYPLDNRTLMDKFVARAPADGYTLLAYGINFTANPGLFRTVPYDAQKDFAPVAGLIRTPSVLIVAADSPFRTVADVVAQARAKPGVLSYSSGGNGSMGHLGGELFKTGFGIDVLHTPYKGSPEVFTSPLSKQTVYSLPVFNSALTQIKAGSFRGLAVTSPRRMPQLPEAPTMHELLPTGGFDLAAENGIVAPAGVPPDIIAKLASTITGILREPEVADRLVATGFEIAARTPAKLGARIAKNLARYVEVVRKAHAQGD